MLEYLISPYGKDSLDINAIRETLKSYLISNSVISDVNYLGSNISILVDIISYAIQSVNSAGALSSNQTMLLTSNIRQNILTLASQMGYNITRPISAKMSVTISYPLVDGQTISIPAYSKWKCGAYNFLNQSDIYLTNSTNSITLNLIEGENIDWTIDSSLEFSIIEPTGFVTIPYKNIENDTVRVYIKKAYDSVYSDAWSKINSLLNLKFEDRKFFESIEADTGWLRIYSFFASLGNELDDGDSVRVAFINSNGGLANGIADCKPDFQAKLATGEDVNLIVTVLSASSGGQDIESSESIKANAPQFYNTGNREVSEDDYSAFLIKSSLVSKAISWGGELMNPEKMGYIFFSCIPQDVTKMILDAESEAAILSMLSENRIISTKRLMFHPVYFYVDFDINIVGTLPNILTRQNQISDVLSSYFDNSLSDFNSYVYESKLVKEIEQVFVNDLTASSATVVKPRIELTEDIFTKNQYNGKVVIFIPNTTSRYYLTKDGVRIPVPKNNLDFVTFIENGWTKVYQSTEDLDVTFSGEFGGFDLVTSARYTEGVEDFKDLTLNDILVGRFNISRSELLMEPSFISYLTTPKNLFLNYTPGFNVVFNHNSLIRLGDIVYV